MVGCSQRSHVQIEMKKERFTRGQKAYLTRLKKIFYSSKFLDGIEKLREEYGIPKDSYKDKEGIKKCLGRGYSYSYSEPKGLRDQLLKLLQKFKLNWAELRPAWGFLFYGDNYLEKFFEQASPHRTLDEIEVVYFPELKVMPKQWFEIRKKRHPVAILLSPNASRGMVRDFMKEHWDFIEDCQEESLGAGQKKKQERVRPAFDRYRRIEVELKNSTYKKIAVKKLKTKGVVEGTPEWRDKLEREEGALRSAMSKYRKTRK